jgi:phosphatidylserine/phosphatidylglycerophosphate/cardiolipin synthase-like enzyme
MRLLRRAAALGLSASLCACAALPPLPARKPSQALVQPETTALGRRVLAERGAVPPTQSGLRLLVNGEDALATLLALTDAAERTLDLQYYAVLNETSSRVLLERVRAAADRGVRVRLLVDDFNTTGTDDAMLRMTRHPRIEVRLYNPLPAGRLSVVTKVLASLHDVARINSRMHNKQLVADNTLAVTGGRNLGDAYFLQAAEANFVDLDLLVAGLVVRQLSATFDRYWNSELAYPVEVLVAPGTAPAAADGASEPASVPLDAESALPAGARERIAAQVLALRGGALRLQWSPVRLLTDAPSKSLAEGDPKDAEIMYDDVGALLRSAQREVLLVTPYLVPGRAGMALIGELRARGVRVRILTASLAGTDAPAVHVGYSRYRQGLLDLGVELFELRAEPGGPKPPRLGGVHSRTNLHAKALLIDGRTVMVGSMNFDPRSEKLNTEMGLLARSDALGAEVQRLFEQICRVGAYRVDNDASGALRWTWSDGQGREQVFESEPEVSWFKRLGIRLLAPLAPESML